MSKALLWTLKFFPPATSTPGPLSVVTRAQAWLTLPTGMSGRARHSPVKLLNSRTELNSLPDSRSLDPHMTTWVVGLVTTKHGLQRLAAYAVGGRDGA